jgi:hypothetical protein
MCDYFCSQVSVLESRKCKALLPSLLAPCDVIKTKRAAQGQEEAPTQTAVASDSLLPGGLSARYCCLHKQKRSWPVELPSQRAGYAALAKDSALDGLQVQMSAGDLTSWPEYSEAQGSLGGAGSQD